MHKILIVLLGAFALPSALPAADVLSDEFAGTTIDATKWKVNTAATGSTVTQNDGLIFQNGGMLNSVAQFKPSVENPVTLKGSFTFEKIDHPSAPLMEIMAIATRSDAVNAADMPQNGILIQVFVTKEGEDQVIAYTRFNGNFNGGQVDGQDTPPDAPGALIRRDAENKLDLTEGDTVNFTLVDNGETVEFTVAKAGAEDTNFATIIGASNFDTPTNYISFQNRASGDPAKFNVTKLTHLSVTSGTP